jgi:hypothetical protein
LHDPSGSPAESSMSMKANAKPRFEHAQWPGNPRALAKTHCVRQSRQSLTYGT